MPIFGVSLTIEEHPAVVFDGIFIN